MHVGDEGAVGVKAEVADGVVLVCPVGVGPTRAGEPAEIVHAMGTLKLACSLVNDEAGRLPEGTGALITQAAAEVADGALDASELTAACRQRCSERDADIRAWADEIGGVGRMLRALGQGHRLTVEIAPQEEITAIRMNQGIPGGGIHLGFHNTEGITHRIVAGTMYRGQFEERLKRVIDELKKSGAVLFIDEVHMLSTAAFNALLKTLEEPPPHAIFVLATTEIHKIPATVLSRCQRHEFRRVPVDEIVGQLKRISKEEKIKVDDDALSLIARQAAGGMRDAISLLDQLSSTGEKIDLPLTQTVLGTAASQTVLNLIASIAGGKPTPAMDDIH